MKTLIVITGIISSLISPISIPSSSYALILPECVIYLDEQTQTPLFTLPQNYFVQILEEGETVHKVSYLDIVGYVKAECTTSVDYVPLNKYPQNISSSVFNDGNTVTLRSSPFVLDDNIISRLSDGERVAFYGERLGDNQIPILGSSWYYVKTESGKVGYIYNLYLSPPTIPDNDYTAREVAPQSKISSSYSLSSLESGIIILFLSLFFILLLFLSFKPKSQKS